MPCHFLLLYNPSNSISQAKIEPIFDTIFEHLQSIHKDDYFSVQILHEIQAPLAQGERESFKVYHENYLISVLDALVEEGYEMNDESGINGDGAKQTKNVPPSSSRDTPNSPTSLPTYSTTSSSSLLNCIHLLRWSIVSMFEELEEQLSNKTHVNIFIFMDQEYASGFDLSSSFHNILPILQSKIYIITPKDVKISESFWRPFSILMKADILTDMDSETARAFVNERFGPTQPCYIAYGHMLQPISINPDPVLYNIKNIVPKILSIQAFIPLTYVNAVSSFAKFRLDLVNEIQTQVKYSTSKSPYIVEAHGCTSLGTTHNTNPMNLSSDSATINEEEECNFFQLLSKLILQKQIAPIVALNEGALGIILPAYKKNKYELTLTCIQESEHSAAPWLRKSITSLLKESTAKAFQFTSEESVSLFETLQTEDTENILNLDKRSIKITFDRVRRLLHAGKSKFDMCLKECERIRVTCILYKNKPLFNSFIRVLKQENTLIKASYIDELINRLISFPRQTLSEFSATEMEET